MKSIFLGKVILNTPCLFPLDAQLNLPNHSYSYSLQKMIALEAIRNSFDEVVESIFSTIGTKISKWKAEEVVLNCPQYFYGYYEQKENIKGNQEVESKLAHLNPSITWIGED